MSLINACIARDHAVVVMDTQARAMWPTPGPFFDVSKMLPLPHANVLLAGCGSVEFIASLQFGLSSLQTASFTRMAEALQSDMLRQSDQGAAAMKKAMGAPSHYEDGQDVYLIGWSDAKGSMHGISCSREPGSTRWETLDMCSTWVSPWGDDWGDLPEPRDVDHLAAVANDQVRRVRAESPGIPIGGSLVFAALTRDTLKFSRRAARAWEGADHG